MFDKAQIQEFKEAFNMIDQNNDSVIDKDDLREMLNSLGKNPDDGYLEGMMNEAPGPINFTMFLTLFGERLQGTDPGKRLIFVVVFTYWIIVFHGFDNSLLLSDRIEDVIKNAFACFDEENSGVLSEDRLRELLTTMGDRFSPEEVI